MRIDGRPARFDHKLPKNPSYDAYGQNGKHQAVVQPRETIDTLPVIAQGQGKAHNQRHGQDGDRRGLERRFVAQVRKPVEAPRLAPDEECCKRCAADQIQSDERCDGNLPSFATEASGASERICSAIQVMGQRPAGFAKPRRS